MKSTGTVTGKQQVQLQVNNR